MSGECDLRDFPYMPLFIERLRRSKAWLMCKKEPALAFYMINLWTRSWHEVPAGSIENDDDVLADAAMCDPRAWAKVRDKVLRGWVETDGRLLNATVTELARDAWETRRERDAPASNKSERQRRWRERLKELSGRLRELGVTPPNGATVVALERLVRDAEASTEASPASTDAPTPRLLETGVKRREEKGEGIEEGIEDTSLRSVVPRRGTDDADFDRFWVVYPRKDAKIDAQKAWKAARKLASAEEIIGGLEQYPFEVETRLQKLPAGWLREGRWQRELDTRPVTVALPRQSGRAEDLVTDYGLDLSTPIDEQFPLEEREREREYAASGRGRLAYEAGTGDGGR